MAESKRITETLAKFKYPLIILLIGVLLLLMPSGEKKDAAAEGEDNAMAAILSSVEGVGEVKVLISDKGVVVVCRGAGNAAVRLNVTKAVRSYTGFSSEKITILKMTD